MARLAARISLPAIFGAKSLRAGLKVNLIGLRKYESGGCGTMLSTSSNAASKKAARNYRAAFLIVLYYRIQRCSRASRLDVSQRLPPIFSTSE